MPFKDKCKICGRVLPYSYLRRCWKCGKLFCVDCMVPEVSTGDIKRLLCLNCAMKIVSPKTRTKYEALTSYLKFRAAFTDSVKLSFAQIDGIIGDNLPISAYRSESWWENSSEKEHAKAWLEAGWKIGEVNLKEGYVVFQKVKCLPAATFKRKAYSQFKKPFKPAPSRILRTRKTSKTKISKLYARLKNIERQRATPLKLRGNLKPKPAQEKRVFKLKEKPQ
ncbi:MAG: DUF7662 domain-containing protein [Candidatus Bathyarchaeales archaeon]